MAMNQRGGMPRPWTPQQDVDQSLAYSDPVQQNRAMINESRNNRTNIMGLSEWQDYDAVLQGRGAQMAMPRHDLRSSLPAGYTEGGFDDELNAFADTGSTKRGGIENTPPASLAGLQGAVGMKPADRAKIAAHVRQQAMPGGRRI